MTQPNFDVYRAILYDSPDPQPFTVVRYLPLADALQSQRIRPETHVLVAAIGESQIVLPTLDMIYYHVAQGHREGVDWVASFCVLCNAGSLFHARLKDSIYHFASGGYYDAMSLIADQETHSYWNHLTGICLHGPSAGAQLQHLAPLFQMTASEALVLHPKAHLTVMVMNDDEATTAQRFNAKYRLPEEPMLNDGLLATQAQVDTRLPRYDMGLGIWTPTTQRYYPITTLYKQHNALIDKIDGRAIVVVLDADVTLPMAFYAEAQQLEFRGSELLLTEDTSYKRGFLYYKGVAMPLERPNQNAIRWFGFSSLFSNCEIYGQ